ncbi:MAG: hypothetical protein V1744_00840 [Candidatus Altiarchaeota archaeon]
MDSTTYRALYALSRRLDRGHSISELVRIIRELGYTAYYKNIYDKCQKLKEEGIIRIEKVGMTSPVFLKLTNPLTIDEMASMELMRKKEFLENADNQPIRDIESLRFSSLKSTALIDPGKNRKLNTTELLLILDSDKEADIIFKGIKKISKKYNKTIYPLLLTEKEFRAQLEDQGYNPVKEMLIDKIVLENPSSFWRTLSGVRISDIAEVDLRKINSSSLHQTLERFGYSAFTTKQSEKIQDLSVETAIIACLLKDDARLTDAAAVLIAKNQINSRLLLYLGLKYGRINLIGYLMETVKTLTRDDDKRTALASGLALFNVFHERASSDTIAGGWGVETRTTAHDLEFTLRRYNAA